MRNYNLLNWLNSWYISQCNGDWEHEYGIKINTIDNPGWSVSIDLTNISNDSIIKDFDWESIELNDEFINYKSDYNEYEDVNSHTWVGVGYEVKNRVFNAVCSRYINLEILILIFKNIIEGHPMNDKEIKDIIIYLSNTQN